MRLLFGAFSSGDQLSGKSFSRETPFCSGPRQCSQSLAVTEKGKRTNENKTRIIRIGRARRMVFTFQKQANFLTCQELKHRLGRLGGYLSVSSRESRENSAH